MSWSQTHDKTLLYKRATAAEKTCRVAAFDIDWTVIRTRSRRTFATDPSDWEFWCPSVPHKLRRLAETGHQIVFFTNQAGLVKSEKRLSGWTRKIDSVVGALGLDGRVFVLASLQKRGEFRKPRTGMWRYYATHLAAAPPSPAKSFFVGDAAGRPGGAQAKKDFSCSDLKFALNLGLRFYVPEEYFLASTARRDCDRTLAAMGFDPKQHWKRHYEAGKRSPKEPTEAAPAIPMADTPELVLVVGSPASGKTALVLQTLEAHPQAVRVNQDALKTLARCLRAVESALGGGQSAIVDNTNRSRATRARYLKLAARRKIPCRCVWLQTTKEESFHLNAFRGSYGAAGEAGRRRAPDVALHTYFKRLEPPEESEGFAAIATMRFAPGPFRNQRHFDAFYQFHL